MTRVIKAPARFDEPAPRSLFLAGGISNCPDWQSELARKVDLPGDVVVFDPRRDDFPMHDPTAARAQIEWEHRFLCAASAISFWFPSETLCPITLYELGAWSMTRKPLFVGVHPDYKRRADVEIQTALARPEVRIVTSLDDLAVEIRKHFVRG